MERSPFDIKLLVVRSSDLTFGGLFQLFISCPSSDITLPYMSTQREVFEGQTTARRAKRGGLWKGGSRVLPRKFSKTCIANGAIWVIPELYVSIQLAYIVIKFVSKVSFKNYRP